MAQPVDAPLRVHVRVLGPIVFEGRDGMPASPSGALGKALIAALTLARGTMSPTALVDELWGDNPPANEKAALHTLVSRVRAVAVPGLVLSTAAGYALSIGAEGTDLGRAEALRDAATAAASRGDHAEALASASEALALWSGEPGAELSRLGIGAELLARASALHDELRYLRAAARLTTNPSDDGYLKELRDLAAARPLDERLQLRLLEALGAAGRRNEALGAYAELREKLREELGTDPSAALVEAHSRLLRADDAPAGRRVRIGLRAAPNELIGREHDLKAIERLMEHSRLATILGAGGLGKTRLAHELGARAEKVPAVVFVELAGVRTAEDVALALAGTLGIREAGARPRLTDPGVRVDVRDRILGALAERDTLLIVDNCEHIVDAAAEWIDDIVASVASVRVLTTSRAPLAIAAEQIYQLEPLASSNGSGAAPAVALFLARAHAARPGAILPADTVRRLCERLDGLPLAIELAAARVRSMSVDEIERRLDDRFALLSAGARSAPERHRTLLAVINWSWNLLGEAERVVLRRLARFPDGFTSAAAGHAAGGSRDVSAELDSLVGQSLLTVREDESTGILRFRMLETVREFAELALDEAGETDLVCEGAFRWASEFVHEHTPRMGGHDQVLTFHTVALEQDNLIAVLREAMDAGRGVLIAEVFALLGYFWSLRGAHSEVASLAPAAFTAILDVEPEAGRSDNLGLSLAIITGTLLFIDLRTAVRARSRLRKVKRNGGFSDPRLDAMTDVLLAVGNDSRSRRRLSMICESPEPWTSCFGHLMLGQLEENEGRIDEALSHARSAYDLGRKAGDTWSVATAAQGLAELHSQAARPADALEWARRARQGFLELGADQDLRQVTWIEAINLVSIGETDQAQLSLRRFADDEPESIGGFDSHEIGSIRLAGLAELALRRGEVGEGLALYRRAVDQFETAYSRATPWFAIIAAASLSAHTVVDRADSAWCHGVAVRLRSRIRVSYRMRPGAVDKPVLGSGTLGLSAWLLRRGAGQDGATHGLELFALAAGLHARQDLPSLHLDRHEAVAVERAGIRAFEQAKAEAAALGTEASVAHTLELVDALRL